MEKELLKEFVEKNPVNHLSPAFINYLVLESQTMTDLLKDALSRWEESDEEVSEAKEIESLDSADEFFRWMRKKIQGSNKFLLRRVLVEKEALVAEMIQKRILTSMVDEFVENATEFFVRSSENHSDWILEHYHEVRNPYAQSMLCLVLGFRGDESCEAFLLQEILSFRKNYPEDILDQGPVIAIYMLNGLKDQLESEESPENDSKG